MGDVIGVQSYHVPGAAVGVPIKRQNIIYINDELDERQQALVCGHEMGHHFMHRGMNRIFMNLICFNRPTPQGPPFPSAKWPAGWTRP